VTDITVEVVAAPAIEVTVTQAGAPGMSAYQHAFANDPSVGTEAEWLASLQGTDGDPGPAGTITVGSVATGEPGTSAEVENVGTASAAVLNFTIPRGDPGEDAEGGGGAWGSITGTLADQTDLQVALDGKSATGHTHAQSDVTGLTDSLAGKSDTGHAHAQSDITGLSTALAGKADASHTHGTADVAGLDAALAGKSDTGHTHTAANISDFDTAADARVVAGIMGKLDTTAAPELIRDTIGTALVAGANVTITPNDAGDTIEIAATGGGSDLAVAAGSAMNPHTTQGAARNGDLPKNFWQYTGVDGVDNPTNAIAGDEWISA
jgi:hypothetical protein